MLVFLFWNCKEEPKTDKPKVEETVKEEKTILPIHPVMVELGKFVDVVFLDIPSIHQSIVFKKIDEKQAVTIININEAVALYSKIMKREQVVSLPIFEIKNTDNTILSIQGIGFGGPIWAKVLVDKKTLKIKKIEFDYKAESEGYGAAMTQSSFEDKFIGTRIDFKKNTFTLKKNIENRIDDGVIIDGIGGATMTSESVVEMVNYGLQKYRGYLDQK